MIYFMDFVYTKDGKFGMILSFNKELHKYKVVFDYTKETETVEYFYKEDLKVVI